MNKLKRVVIKEELVALTGDYKKALMLNQFIYWSERVKDFDKFMEEEKERYIRHGKSEIADGILLANGWIFKKAEELSDEIMIDYKIKAMREHLKFLVEKGWLDERTNPNFNWDKTKQYRVNLIKIQQDLLKIGYCLEGYSLDINFIKAENTPLVENVQSNEYKKEVRTFQKGNGIDLKETAIPKTTTEITKNIYTKDFETWYGLYPNKFNKEQTFKNWNSILKEDCKENIAKATVEYLKQIKEHKTELKYIIRSTNFIGQKKQYKGYLNETVKPIKPPFGIVEVTI